MTDKLDLNAIETQLKAICTDREDYDAVHALCVEALRLEAANEHLCAEVRRLKRLETWLEQAKRNVRAGPSGPVWPSKIDGYEVAVKEAGVTLEETGADEEKSEGG